MNFPEKNTSIRIANNFYKSILLVDKIKRPKDNKKNISAILEKSSTQNGVKEFFVGDSKTSIIFYATHSSDKIRLATDAEYVVFFFVNKVLFFDITEFNKLCKKLQIDLETVNQTVACESKEYIYKASKESDSEVEIKLPIRLVDKLGIQYKIYTLFETHINEDFLHFIWKNKLFSQEQKTVDNLPIKVLNVGTHNFYSGPDFINAKLKIGEIEWNGNVEIHLKSSDWNLHKHTNDEAYNNVVLHVVKTHNKEIVNSRNSSIPCLELDYPEVYEYNYKKLIESDKLIVCEDNLSKVDKFKFMLNLNKFAIERLERKSVEIYDLLRSVESDWLKTFYILLAKHMGMKVNSFSFEYLFRSFDLKIIDKHSNDLSQIEALLFGQAGFLETELDDLYYLSLQNEYKFLKSKYKLKPLDKHIWKFMRIRPSSFPTIRISQIANLLYKQQKLHSILVDHKPDKLFIQNLLKIDASVYWNDHYNFSKVSKISKHKFVGKSLINNLIINSIVPYLFAYSKYILSDTLKDYALDLLEQIEAENNSVIERWKSNGFEIKSAFQTQAFIQLTNDYCYRLKCLSCPIGAEICKTR
jgi:hypothetical protein